MSSGNWVIGVDVGGTFTDVFARDDLTGEVRLAKVPSTPDNQAAGFVAGIDQAVADFAAISSVVHGTTVGTNALLQRAGAHTGIITTRGFRDVLEMRRRDRPTTWGLWGTFDPVVSRDVRLEVTERTLADGTVREAVDLGEVRKAAETLLERGCEAVCIFFINGYANDSNERAAAEAVRAMWPTSHVTVATEILPEIREFERCSTATLNAYVQPVVSTYLDRLQTALRERACPALVSIVQSNGGVMELDTARQMPVRTALSGPAAGVIAAQHIATTAGLRNVITCDMGGTSFDVSLIVDGESSLAAQTQIDFGLVIRTPMIEISTIGAGGGSIAAVDAGGLLGVGPTSAGSDPGPVCYGLGNDLPTVTDANLVLGRINPARPIGDLASLDLAAARAAIDERVARPLGLGVNEAADAIVRVANARMAGAIRLVSIERGHDPADFAAMPFGGGGALHTGALMREIGLGAAIVPRYPGVISAMGCVLADMRFDIVQTINHALDQLDVDALRNKVAALKTRFGALLTDSTAPVQSIEYVCDLDMLYAGQTHTLHVPVPSAEDALSITAIRAAFEQTYLATYGRLLHGGVPRVINLKVAAIGKRPRLELSLDAGTRDSAAACQCDSREVWWQGRAVSAPVYERLQLPVGAAIAGPALLEQPDATTFVDPGLRGVVDRFGNLVMREDSA